MTPLLTVYYKSEYGVARCDLMRAETPDELPSWRVCRASQWGFDLTPDSSLTGHEGEIPATEAEYKAMYALAAKLVAEYNNFAYEPRPV